MIVKDDNPVLARLARVRAARSRWREVRDPVTLKLLFRYDTVARVIEIRHRQRTTLVRLTEIENRDRM